MGKLITYPFGEVTIYKNYLVAIMNEGVTISPNLNDVLERISKEYFADTKFVYITHRINSYAVDPSIYFKTSKIENLAGFAVVTGKKIVIDNTDLESSFLTKPFKAFSNLENAISWAKKLCE